MNHALWPPNRHLSEWILRQFPEGHIGYAVDVGASDGISINTTFGLEEARWTVLSVEANPDFGPMLKKHRAFVEMSAVGWKPGTATFHINDTNPEAYSALSVTGRRDLPGVGDAKFRDITVPVTTVDALMEKWEFPRLDVLCIDTEGTELDVLRGANIPKWRPRTIVAEMWGEVGPLDLWLESHGYTKVARSVDNHCWTIKEDA